METNFVICFYQKPTSVVRKLSGRPTFIVNDDGEPLRYQCDSLVYLFYPAPITNRDKDYFLMFLRPLDIGCILVDDCEVNGTSMYLIFTIAETLQLPEPEKIICFN